MNVTLSAAPEREVTIPITATDQGGVGVDDYSGVPASVTFGAADTSKSFTFSAAQDDVDDDGESVWLRFGILPSGVTQDTSVPPGDNRGLDTTTVTITDNDDPAVEVTFATASHTVAEGATTTVTLHLSAIPERSVTIPLTRNNQGGASAADYSMDITNVNFNSGDISKTVAFNATQDTVDDDGESVLIGFGTLPTGVSAGTIASTTVSITDDDVPSVTASFEQATYTVAEGSGVTVKVTLSADPERSVTVPLTNTNQAGATSTDYNGVPASITFDSGDTSRTFTFTAISDSDNDDGESVKLGFGTLPVGVSAGSTDETTVTITDDDVPSVNVSFATSTYTVNEGSSINIAVSLSADPERTVTIPLTITNQGGATDADHSLVPEGITFNSGQTSRTFSFQADQDSDNDDGESVKLGFGTLPTSVSAGTTASTTVSITDDDRPSALTVSFAAAAYTVAESDVATTTDVEEHKVAVRVVLSVDPETSLTIPISRTEQDGASSADYSGVPQSVTFESGELEQTITFTATHDTLNDDGESVKLGFGTLPTTPIGVTAGATDEATVSIADDDDVQDAGSAPVNSVVTLRVSPSTIEEQGGDWPSTAMVTASLDKPSTDETTVTVSTDPAEAVWFALSTDRELTIPAGSSTSIGDVTITAMDMNGVNQVLTVEGSALNSEGVDGPDPVTLTVFAKDSYVIGYPENATDPVTIFTSTDPENGRPGEGIDWDVTGVDADDFLIDARGMLIFRRSPDYESPTDRSGTPVDLNEPTATTEANNMYHITVRATEQETGGPDQNALSTESRFTIMVTNVNEEARVTMNRLQPEVGTPIKAVLNDRDGDVDTNGTVGSGDDRVTLGWQWYVSKVQEPIGDVEGHWTAATGVGNETATYTPAGNRVTDTTSTEVDEGRYLRAVVRYLDMGVEDTDDGVTTSMVRKVIGVSAHPVRAEVSSDLDGVENTENGSPGFSPANDYTRTVPEDTPVGDPVGDPVVAVDPNDDILTYELDDDTDTAAADTSGDVGHFSIDMATGQIEVAKTLDYEGEPDGYEFYVRATDPSGETAEVMVTVIATDANDPPVIMGSRTADSTDKTPAAPSEFHVKEMDDDNGDDYTGGPHMLLIGKSGSGIGARNVFTAMDEDARGQISWYIEGEDVDDFVLSSSGLGGPDEPIALMFNSPPDHEAPTDANSDNVYKVTLVARDSHGAVDQRPLAVLVDNVEEMGRITLSEEQPLIGQPTTATVEDADSSLAIVTWQWMRATSTDADFNVIPGATTATYSPEEADSGLYLRAYATYIDSTSYADDPDTWTVDERTQKLEGGVIVPREATMMDGSETDSDRLYRVMVMSDYAVRGEADTTKTDDSPEFALTTYDRTVVENAEVGTIVGSPVQAVPELDDDGNSSTTFRYDLDATVTGDDRYFTIDADSGQIRVGEVRFPNPLPAQVSAVPAGATAPDMDDPVLDHEGDNTFSLVVTAEDASDPSRKAITEVTISLENLNERPYFDRASRDAVSDPITYGERRVTSVVQLAAVEPDGHVLRWEVTGPDASDFVILDAEDVDDGKDRRRLEFRNRPDYENGRGSATSTDGAAGDTYMVTVRATETTATGNGPVKAAELQVTVQVANANESGTVDFSLLQPEVGTGITATTTDVDGVSGTVTYTWYRAKVADPNRNIGPDDDLGDEWEQRSTGTVGAGNMTYTPQGVVRADDGGTTGTAMDEDRYLLASATYQDGTGATTTAFGITAYPVRPDVADALNNSPDFSSNSTTREVPENTPVGMPVGEPVDVDQKEDGDVLTYEFVTDSTDNPDATAEDAAFFSIDMATGQIMVKKKLSSEMTDGRDYTASPAPDAGMYVVVVRATDPSGETTDGENSDDITVTITATDVNEAPSVSGTTEISVNEADGSEDDHYVGLGNTADADGNITPNSTSTNLYRGLEEDTFDLLTWPSPIAGPDGALFEYSTHGSGRRLHFISPPDFEDPKDANRDNVHEVTLRVTDKAGLVGEKSVRITVMNVDEMGTLALSPEQPREGVPVIATLTDPDGILGITDWEWFATSSRSRADAVRVGGATASEYTGEVGNFIWATVRYRDGASVEDDPITALDERNDNPTTDTLTEQHRYQYRNDNGVLDDSDTLFHNSDEITEKGTENAVQAYPDPGGSPDSTSGEVETFELMVHENAPSTAYVGVPLPDLGPRHEIGGPDGDAFVLAEDMDDSGYAYYDSILSPLVDIEDDKAGQLAAAMVAHFDYEAGKNTYVIDVMDPNGPVGVSTYRITIMIMDVNEPPTPPTEVRGLPASNTAPDFGATSTVRMVVEDASPGTNIGEPVTATDVDRGDQETLVYTLGGPDGASFTIDPDTGQLYTSAALDYETKSEYIVEVTAADDHDASATIMVTIMVTEVGASG